LQVNIAKENQETHNENDEFFFHKEFEIAMLTSHLHEKDTNWYLDSKATFHVTGDVGKLTNIRKAVGVTNIKSPSGHTHKVHGKGNNIVVYQDETKSMSNILYVPSVKKNLLSIGALVDMGCIVVSGKAKCWILSTNISNKVLTFGVRDAKNGLYKLEASTLHKLQHKPPSLCLNVQQLSNVELWHKRMGHISF